MATDQMQEPMTYGDPQLGGMLPPTNPVAPPPPPQGNVLDPSQVQAQAGQVGIQGFQGAQEDLQAKAQQLQQAMAERASMAQPENQPKRGLTDESWMKMAPVRGQGFAHDTGNVLGDIGKALLLGLANGTGVGRGIQQGAYAPGIKRYETQTAEKASQIEDIQKQMSGDVGAEQAATGLGSKYMTAGAAQQRAGAAVMNAQTKQTAEAHKSKIDEQGLALKKQLGEGKITVDQAKIKMQKVIADEVTGAQRDVAGIHAGSAEGVEQQKTAEDYLKEQTDHWLQDFMGMMPPKPGVSPNAPRGAKQASGTVEHWTRDAKGNLVKR